MEEKEKGDGMTFEQALRRLQDKGYKTTGKREEMLHYLAKSNRFLTARELSEHLLRNYPGISFDTIYRNLALFKELEIVEETEMDGERMYLFRCHGTEGHHHHFICVTCGQTEAVDVCPTDVSLNLPPGCLVTGHKFELYGLCPRCHS